MADFTGFPPEAVKFFKGLKENNNKTWFEARKSDYQKFVLEPAQDFIVEIGSLLKNLSPGIHAEPRVNKSIFRIYRDIRFSKDVAQLDQLLGHRMPPASGYHLQI